MTVDAGVRKVCEGFVRVAGPGVATGSEGVMTMLGIAVFRGVRGMVVWICGMVVWDEG